VADGRLTPVTRQHARRAVLAAAAGIPAAWALRQISRSWVLGEPAAGAGATTAETARHTAPVPARTVPLAPGRLAGRQFGFFSDPDPRSLEAIAGTGVGGVSMGPYFVVASPAASIIGAPVNADPSTIITQMQFARANGLRVTLKPMIDARTYPPRAGGRPALDPVDADAWFAGYWQDALQPYLPWADSLVVYTELNTISAGYPDRWATLVRQVRSSGFLGPIASDADVSTTTTPWYRQLDWLGGSFYPVIDVSSDAAAVRSWRSVATQMSVAHTASGLPIFMAEVGAAPMGEAGLVRWIESMGEVLAPLPWWAGFSYWRWPQLPGDSLSPAVQQAFRRVASNTVTNHPVV
jgi:glycosyl hydrolase family 113